ncbi:hypothetical protein PAAG_02066 [Paracoccidioides lutzii Pb01]|uniref:Rhodopsin domain-containing protein n=1 Tax=Paracoccidioides lutzii (strain ATCC MYA-826 / Pb01) TaxID=502779 RepID=C1GU71_PARBA|nr:hypothetical protein PAAG_02066 [Paracoccidioides lutzii Pb01]EEH39877.2 hypothetical protein PAAG_02066 [Paracoccidioides lutzii Pb01]
MTNFGRPIPGIPNKGWQLWNISVVMVIISGLFVVTRMTARYSHGGIRADDWTIFAAMFAAVVLSVAHIMAVESGFGKHEWDLTHGEMIQALKFVFAAQVMYKFVICFTKTSILLLYLRAFYVRRYFRWGCYLMITFTVATGIAYIPPTIWQCTPVASFWDRSIPHNCISNRPSWLSYTLVNILSDFMILILPIQEVLRLQLKTRDKVAVIMIFAVGAFVCVTSIVRATTIAASAKVKDVTWSPIPIACWSTVEIHTGIICSCMPMIRQPLAFLFPRLFPISSRHDSDPNTNTYVKNTRRRKGGDTLATDGLAWMQNHDDHIHLTSIKFYKEGQCRPTESEERIFNMENLQPPENGIVTRTDVSITETRSA